MLKISATVCLLASLAYLVISSENSANKKVFHFTKVPNEANGFQFEYTLDNGEIFSGKCIRLHKRASSIFVMVGADDSFYWVNLSQEDRQKDSFDKIVNYVQLDRENDILAHLMDDFVSYHIHKSGKLSGGTYMTSWDVNNVTFQLTDVEEKTFDYVISATNNGRLHRNKTSYTDDPHIQTVIVPDYHRCYLFQVTFSDDEFSSNQTIHKQLDQSMVCQPPYHHHHHNHHHHRPGAPIEIDPVLLKSLTG